MKLKKISEPRAVKYTEKNIFGDVSETEIISYSQFDLLPASVQWGFMGVMLLVILGAIVALVVS